MHMEQYVQKLVSKLQLNWGNQMKSSFTSTKYHTLVYFPPLEGQTDIVSSNIQTSF